MTADLRHILIREGDAYAPVSGGYDPGNILLFQSCFFKHVV